MGQKMEIKVSVSVMWKPARDRARYWKKGTQDIYQVMHQQNTNNPSKSTSTIMMVRLARFLMTGLIVRRLGTGFCGGRKLYAVLVTTYWRLAT